MVQVQFTIAWKLASSLYVLRNDSNVEILQGKYFVHIEWAQDLQKTVYQEYANSWLKESNSDFDMSRDIS